jgi:putative intracellular protease/amidase
MTIELQRVREAEPPPVDRVRRRVARRRARRRVIAAVSTMAVALLAIGLATRPSVRDRGLAGVPQVALDAVAEGAGSPRALRDGDAVGAGERVVFFVRSSADGWATIREEGGAVVDQWPIRAGESAVGGETPQSWRPDRPLGALRYELEVCPERERASGCGSAGMTLRWAP